MHIIIPVFALGLLYVAYRVYKQHKRDSAIGTEQDRTDDLKAQQELKDLKESNDSLETKINGEEHE